MDDVVCYIVSPNAAYDIEEILRYLTREAGLSIAEDVEDKLFSSFDRLTEFPILGHRRSDLTDRVEFRFYFVKPYMVVFQRYATEVIIHAVLHGARDVKDTLHRRDIM